jgi:hypothetical protein
LSSSAAGILLLGLFRRYHGLDLRRVERVEGRIALLAFVGAVARPLRVRLAPGPGTVAFDRGELKLLVLGGKHACRAVARMVGRTPAHRLVDHVDDIAEADEIFRPALAAVGRAHPVGCGLRRAVDQHERVGAALDLRRQHFDIDLSLHDVLAGIADIVAADVEKAPLRNC